MLKNDRKFQWEYVMSNGYDSELLLKILNKTSIKTKNSDDKELFVDENWKIKAKKYD